MVSILFIYIHSDFFSNRDQTFTLYQLVYRTREYIFISYFYNDFYRCFMQRPARVVLSVLRLAATIAEAAALSARRVVLADNVVCCCRCCWSRLG